MPLPWMTAFALQQTHRISYSQLRIVGAIVSKWLEDRAVHAGRTAEQKSRTNLVAKHSHVHEDIEMDMGGGWCDMCGCWLHHGRDPNGTPQAEIGHPYVCQGDASTQNCWSHYYKYCLTS